MPLPASCNELFALDRTKRLSEFLWTRMDHFTERFHPEYVGAKLGVCQVCGHPLKIAVRAMKCNDDLSMECIEAAPNSEALDKYFAIKASGDKLKLQEKGWTFAEQAACPSLDEEIWFAALRVNRNRFQGMRDAMNEKHEPQRPRNKLRA